MSGVDYQQAGVNIDAGNETVRRIKALAKKHVHRPACSPASGSFGGLFALGKGVEDPVLVASADGVGTKLKVAFMTGIHDTIGVDLVNHCVNDILVQGARPLFFLDYLATGRLAPDVAEQIVTGVARACEDNGCALLGGETAEMPGFYADGEYDVAGFIVGSGRAGESDRRPTISRPAIVSSRCRRPACTPTAIHWRARSRSSTLASPSRATSLSWARRLAPRCCGRTGRISMP